MKLQVKSNKKLGAEKRKFIKEKEANNIRSLDDLIKYTLQLEKRIAVLENRTTNNGNANSGNGNGNPNKNNK